MLLPTGKGALYEDVDVRDVVRISQKEVNGRMFARITFKDGRVLVVADHTVADLFAREYHDIFKAHALEVFLRLAEGVPE